MGTDKRQVIAYISDQLHQALEQYRGTHGHKSLSVAIAAILSNALLGESDGRAVDNSGELLGDLLARLDAIERRLSQLESKALAPLPTPSKPVAAIASGGGEWLTPKQAYSILGHQLEITLQGFYSALDRSQKAGQLSKKLAAAGLVADFSRRDGSNTAKWLKINPPQSE